MSETFAYPVSDREERCKSSPPNEVTKDGVEMACAEHEGDGDGNDKPAGRGQATYA